MARTNQRSPITRSAYAIRRPPQWNEAFGTHRGIFIDGERNFSAAIAFECFEGSEGFESAPPGHIRCRKYLLNLLKVPRVGIFRGPY
jgi:hypothetical protein